jgi:hypothetical protein
MVEGEHRSAVRWEVVKLSTKRMSGFVGVELNGGILVLDVEGVTTW